MLCASRVTPFKSSGFTLAEVMISMAIIGLMATMMIPQVVNQSGDKQNKQISQSVETMVQQLSSAIYNYQQVNAYSDEELEGYISPSSGTPLLTYTSIFYYYGNYFSYKQKSTTGAKYYYFMDKSRLAFDPVFYTEANAAAINADIDSNCRNGTTQNYCAYLDYNGRTGAGIVSDSGDVIPLYINPETHSVQTLYEAKGNNANASSLCSAYDRIKYGCYFVEPP